MRAITLGLLCVVLASCAGTAAQDYARAEKATDAVSSVTEAWQRATAQRRLTTACSLLNPAGERMIARELSGFEHAGLNTSSCPALIAFVHDALLTPTSRREMEDSRPTRVTIAGPNATVQYSGGIYKLQRVRDGWRISQVPLVASQSASR
ncbi:MAG TPA: hypothetical protein VMB91_04490 [Solirubrobacteraceae bacterium]|nr:hypothetical protein [Solirubrobacteraceae bacterium]